MYIWQNLGMQMLIVLSGLQYISEELYGGCQKLMDVPPLRIYLYYGTRIEEHTGIRFGICDYQFPRKYSLRCMY